MKIGNIKLDVMDWNTRIDQVIQQKCRYSPEAPPREDLITPLLPDSLIPFSSFPSAAAGSEDGEPRWRGTDWRGARGFMAVEAVELTGDTQSASLSRSCKTGLHPVARDWSGFGRRVPLLSRVSTVRRYQGLA